MPTTRDTLRETATAVTDRVAEGVRDTAKTATALAKDARQFGERAADAWEDGLHDAKRTLKRGLHELEDLRDQTAVQVRRQPFAALGATFLVGLTLGTMFTLLTTRRPRRRDQSQSGRR